MRGNALELRSESRAGDPWPERAAEAFLIGFLRRDYGAAGLYDMARNHEMDALQLVVSMVTISVSCGPICAPT